MKKINEKIKSLFKVEVNKDLLKVALVLIFYLFAIFIFRAGYEFRNFAQVSKKTERPKINEYKYYITYKGDKDQYNFNEPKTLFSLLDEIENVDLDVVSYYEGNKLIGIGGSSKFEIKVNGKQVESNFFKNNEENLKSGTKIEVIN